LSIPSKDVEEVVGHQRNLQCASFTLLFVGSSG
jgi:hypothetical protein